MNPKIFAVKMGMQFSADFWFTADRLSDIVLVVENYFSGIRAPAIDKLVI